MILSDAKITEAIEKGEIKISPSLKTVKQALGKRSLQPSSLDLTIGRIFVPPKEVAISDIDKREIFGRQSFELLPGHTAVIETKEIIQLSSKYCAFGFAPNRLSSNAILMTNPGHVDPGFDGYLTFTIINLGRNSHYFERGERIFSLLICKTDGEILKKYEELTASTEEFKKVKRLALLNKLSPDFANYTARMNMAAKAAVEKHAGSLEVSRLVMPAFAGAISAALIALLAAYSPVLGFFDGEMSNLNEKLNILQKRVETLEAQQ